MINKYPVWKYLIVLFVLVFSVVYALPNVYPDDPAVQITGAEAGIEITEQTLAKSVAALQAEGIPYFGEQLQPRSMLIRFNNAEDQLRAKDVLQADLGERFLSALNLAPTTPDWLRSLGAGPMKLGLDLRGGVHFLMEVDMDKAINQRLESYADELRTRMREEKIRYARIADESGVGIQVAYRSAEDLAAALSIVRADYREFNITEKPPAQLFEATLALNDLKLKEIQDYAISQNLTTLRNRVNELGVAEPLVQRQGANRIVVELPGVQDTAQAKRVLGRTASLEFRMVDKDNDVRTALSGRVPPGTELHFFREGKPEPPALLERRVIVTGEQVIDAQASYDENGRPQVNISLDGKGGKRMLKATGNRIGDQMAVLFVESKTRTVETSEGGETVKKRQRYEEKYLINVATVQAALGSRFRITGLDSPFESSELALLLRAGALAAPMYFVEERTVGPSMGQENIDAGLLSIIVGLSAVLFFILVYYRVFGLFANIALTANLVILVAVMSLIPGATLTLPGIAGIVLTVGMAVDANVLIFARIREELANGLAPQAAINAGYERAFLTILDANITTLIVAVILFAAGNGPVKGFAVTLSIGICTSMFTAILGTRALVNLTYGRRRRLEKLRV